MSPRLCARLRLRPGLRVALAVIVLGALALLGLQFGGLGTGLLDMAPAFVLALTLLAGRYPGVDVLIRSRRRPQRRRPGARPALRPPARPLPRGGLLVGHALAGRAPPA